jgi:hypothetical protein
MQVVLPKRGIISVERRFRLYSSKARVQAILQNNSHRPYVQESRLPLFTNRREVKFSETELRRVPILGDWWIDESSSLSGIEIS